MPDPAELLATARLLLNGSGSIPPSDAQLRRATSTAYYAVFHKIAQTAARRFLGQDQESSAAYTILYRGFDHRKMKEVCENLIGPVLRERYRRQLRRSTVSATLRDFASSFPVLQEYRHLADYDPSLKFLASEVAAIITAAHGAVDAFERISPEEQTDVLALMLIGARG
jgi:uncharacterized protein (UPF0332 family)